MSNLTTQDEFQLEAQAFLDRHYISFHVKLLGTHCPPWESKDSEHIHGDMWQITLSRFGRDDFQFDFWNSLADKQAGKKPGAYDVLASLYTGPVDSFEEWCNDLWYDVDSRSAHKIYKRCKKLAKKLKQFFSDDELEELAEIQ